MSRCGDEDVQFYALLMCVLPAEQPLGLGRVPQGPLGSTGPPLLAQPFLVEPAGPFAAENVQRGLVIREMVVVRNDVERLGAGPALAGDAQKTRLSGGIGRDPGVQLVRRRKVRLGFDCVEAERGNPQVRVDPA